MKYPTLRVKRSSVKKGALRTLFVNVVRSKRHRAATAAPFLSGHAEGDVPNVGVARALVVILAIHVLAIVGFFVHNHYFEGKGGVAAVQAGPQDAPRSEGPKGTENDQRHKVMTGESYKSIATDYGVDVKALQEVNGNADLRAGMLLKLPEKAPTEVKALEPPDLAKIREGNPLASLNTQVSTSPPPKATLVDETPMVEVKPASRPVLVKSGSHHSDSDSDGSAPKHAKTLAKGDSTPEKTDKPAKATNSTKKSETPEKTAKTEKSGDKKLASTPPAKKSSSKEVTVKAGDTVWSIAKANGVTPAALMKANGVKDPSKLRTGTDLTIPKN